MGKCTQYIKQKADRRIEHNHDFINCVCKKYLEEMYPKVTESISG